MWVNPAKKTPNTFGCWQEVVRTHVARFEHTCTNEINPSRNVPLAIWSFARLVSKFSECWTPEVLLQFTHHSFAVFLHSLNNNSRNSPIDHCANPVNNSFKIVNLACQFSLFLLWLWFNSASFISKPTRDNGPFVFRSSKTHSIRANIRVSCHKSQAFTQTNRAIMRDQFSAKINTRGDYVDCWSIPTQWEDERGWEEFRLWMRTQFERHNRSFYLLLSLCGCCFAILIFNWEYVMENTVFPENKSDVMKKEMVFKCKNRKKNHKFKVRYVKKLSRFTKSYPIGIPPCLGSKDRKHQEAKVNGIVTLAGRMNL